MSMVNSSDGETTDQEYKQDYLEIEFKSNNEKIAWLHELGVLDVIIEKCKDKNQTINLYQAANLILTFVDINFDTIRKALEAIYQPIEKTATRNGNQKNNPLLSSKTKQAIALKKESFKLK